MTDPSERTRLALALLTAVETIDGAAAREGLQLFVRDTDWTRFCAVVGGGGGGEVLTRARLVDLLVDLAERMR